MLRVLVWLATWATAGAVLAGLALLAVALVRVLV